MPTWTSTSPLKRRRSRFDFCKKLVAKQSHSNLYHFLLIIQVFTFAFILRGTSLLGEVPFYQGDRISHFDSVCVSPKAWVPSYVRSFCAVNHGRATCDLAGVTTHCTLARFLSFFLFFLLFSVLSFVNLCLFFFFLCLFLFLSLSLSPLLSDFLWGKSLVIAHQG